MFFLPNKDLCNKTTSLPLRGVCEVSRRFRTNNPESAANESVGQCTTHPHPPTERGSVYFLGSCSRVPYLQKQVALLPCWINISARRSNNRDSCPSKEEGVQLCSTGPVRPRRSLKDLSLPASGDKHAGQCHASCSLACLSRRL